MATWLARLGQTVAGSQIGRDENIDCGWPLIACLFLWLAVLALPSDQKGYPAING